VSGTVISTPPAPSRLSTALAADRVGAFGIGLSIGSSVAPLTVVAMVITTALALTGQPGIAIGIAAVGVVLLVFAQGYLAMARRITNAGAFYAYAAKGLGRPVGVGVSWVALLIYPGFQIGCYGGVGAIGAPYLQDWTGIGVPWWIVAFACWLVVAVLGALEIGFSEKVLAVLVITETLLVLVYSIAIVTTPGFHFSLHPLAVDNLWGPGAALAIGIGFTAFAGLEQAAAYAEEAKDARRNVARATYATIGVVGLIYVFGATVIYSAAGEQVYQRAGDEGTDLFFNLAAVQLGPWAVEVGRALILTSLLAAMIAFHNLISRYGYALGREGVAPRIFGRTEGKAPRYASFAQSAVGFAVIGLYIWFDWKPLEQLFYWGVTAGGLGVLVLLVVVSISVISYFARDRRGENLWRRLIAPIIATLALLALTYATFRNLPELFGVDGWTGPARVVPAALGVVFAAGVCWGLVLRARKPEVYAKIGLGPDSVTVRAAGATR